MKTNNLIYYLLFLGLFFTSFNSYSQSTPISKKSILIGGDGGFWSHSGDLYEDSDGNKLNSTTLNFNFGYFVANKIALGLKTEYRKDKQGDTKVIDRGIGPYVSYYFGDINKTEIPGTFYPFLSLSYLRKKKSGEYMLSGYEYTESKKIGSIGIQLGGVYMIANSVGIYGTIGYEFDTGDYEFNYDHPNALVPSGEETDQKGRRLTMGLGIKLFIYSKSFE